MVHEKDANLISMENRLLQEEKFELGYRLGLAEGVSAVLEAVCNLNEDFKLDSDTIEKIKNLHNRISPGSFNDL